MPRRTRVLTVLLTALTAVCLVGGLGVVPADATRPADVATSGAAAAPPAAPLATSAHRPNIVLISTDDETLSDMRWMAGTRRILGDHGVTFSNMLSPHPLCCPARAEILTGQYAQNNGVHSNGGPFGGYPALKQPDDTIATWLQSAGYRTAMEGKFLNGFDATLGTPPGWDDWDVTNTDGFGYKSFQMDDNGVVTTYPESAHAYSTDLVAARTTDLIDRWSGEADRPFFIWSSYYAPHGICGVSAACDAPPQPAPRDAHLFPGARNPSLAKPSYAAPLVDPDPMIAHRPVQNRRDMQYLFHRRIQSLAAVDDAVRQTVAALRRNHELDDTYIVFTSDNGYLLGEHHYHGKVLPYEEALRVPLIVRGPGVPTGQTRNQTVTTVDLAPTIAALAGATPQRVQDGRDLTDVITHNAPLKADTVLIQGGPQAVYAHPKPWDYRGVRTARYTYAAWDLKGHMEELYDRRKDPYEIHNLEHDPHYAAILHALRGRTRTLKVCAGDCFERFGPLPAPEPGTSFRSPSPGGAA